MAAYSGKGASAKPSLRLSVVAVIVVSALIVVGLQVLATWRNTQHVAKIFNQIKAIEQKEQLTNEKTRGEIIKLRVENELRSFFWHSLLTGLVPLVTAFVAVMTAWISLRKYLDARDKERLDRAAEDLRSALNQLASKESRERMVGVVGLQHFFSLDKRDYHLRAMSALVAAARLEKNSEVLRSIRIGVEQAVRTVDSTVLHEVSWQGVQLVNADFKSRMLADIDFRDADLENADFSDCNLTGARLTNACLKGARLDKAILAGADLAYADLAGASLRGANLDRANFRHVSVLDLDLSGADLCKTEFNASEFPWELTKHWRDAKLEQFVQTQLLERYGAEPTGVVILMLMWEVPPLVAGGTWTACYHLARNLRQRGANLKIVVPWDEALIMPAPFGSEVEVIPLGIRLPEPTVSIYGDAQWWSPYAQSGWTPSWSSPYGFAGVYGTPTTSWGSYAASISPYGEFPFGRLYSRGTTLLRLTDEFKQRLLRLARSVRFDLIHAHDWVTFAAARAVSSVHRKPWVAHFHSLEVDRRPHMPDSIIVRIEKGAVDGADGLTVPSNVTGGRLKQFYKATEQRITVVPNSLSPSPVAPADMGEFETKRVVFLGRLTKQKGLDRFVQVAAHVLRRDSVASFVVYGSGEEGDRYRRSSDVKFFGPLDWHERARAFGGASVVLVPSRSEPFGMVVLEAMLHRVPVLYPADAGVAEVITSGVPIDPSDIAAMAEDVHRLLNDWAFWESVVEKQSEEIARFPEKNFENTLLSLWKDLTEDD
jgi:glycosyltransferase involved in cell wall biosynthesis